MENETLRVDNTMLSCFTTCPKKFYWRHVRHLVRNGGKVPALEFGKAIHTGLEVFYKGSSIEEAIKAFKSDLSPEAVDDKRNHANGEKILKSYFKQYLPEKWKVIAVEQNLSAPVTEGLELYGYIDLVVEQQGLRYNVEHKTTSGFHTFVPNPNHQITGYIYLSGKNGHEVSGSYVNMLGVFKTKTENRRVMTSRTDEQMRKYLDYVKATGEAIQKCASDDFYPEYTGGCNQYNSKCSFLELCTIGDEMAERVIEQEFVEEEWTPWVSRSEEEKKEVKDD